MDASTNLDGESEQYRTVDVFLDRLRHLTKAQLASVVWRVAHNRETAAADVDWWQATAAVSIELRRRHRARAAASAALQASEAVLAGSASTTVPHDGLVHAARAAGDVARSLVAGGPTPALTILSRGWEDILGTLAPPSRTSAA
jgi:hypothetical protein